MGKVVLMDGWRGEDWARLRKRRSGGAVSTTGTSTTARLTFETPRNLPDAFYLWSRRLIKIRDGAGCGG